MLDSHLVKKLQFEAVFSGISDFTIDALFQPEDTIPIPATVRFSPENTIDIQYHGNRTDPINLEKLHELENNRKINKIKVVLRPGYKINRPEIAIIRIAYLLAFAQFGYGFLFNENLSIIRKQIFNPAHKILPDFGIINSEIPDFLLGINILNKPAELKSFLIVFNSIIGERIERYGVLLPGPTDPGMNIYSFLADQKHEKKAFEIDHNVRLIPKDDYLHNPELTLESYKLWMNS